MAKMQSGIKWWLSRWGAIDWFCLGAVEVVTLGGVVTQGIFANRASYPLWFIPIETAVVGIVIAAALLRIWRPKIVTTLDLVQGPAFFLLALVLFYLGIGGAEGLQALSIQSLRHIGYIAGMGMVVFYCGIWVVMRVLVYWISGRADFRRSD